jgi:hypothetical protein
MGSGQHLRPRDVISRSINTVRAQSACVEAFNAVLGENEALCLCLSDGVRIHKKFRVVKSQ